MSTRKLFNSLTQQAEDAEFIVDGNNEIVATFKDGGFVKFPAGLTPKQFDEAIKAHEVSNTGQEIITEEMVAEQTALRNNSLALIGEDKTSGDTTPEEQQFNAEEASATDTR